MSSRTNALRPTKPWTTEAVEHGESPGHVVLMQDGEARCQTCGQVWRPVQEYAPAQFGSDRPTPTTGPKTLARELLPQVPDRTALPPDAALLAQPEDASDLGDQVLPVAFHELRAAMSALGSKLEGIHRCARASNPDIDALAHQVEMAVRHVSTMSRLLDELLDVPQSQSDEQWSSSRRGMTSVLLHHEFDSAVLGPDGVGSPRFERAILAVALRAQPT
jgi:hypothetical protein